jgi:hypothetical protein
MRMIPILLLVSAAVAATATAQGSGTAFTVAETGRSFPTLAAAIGSIGDGVGTVMIAPGTYRQCAVQSYGAITYRAAQPGTAIFDGAACEEKAALVLRGRSARVEGLVFQNLRVPDGNGAGIRLEHGNLSVIGSIFRNSEEGILTASDPSGWIVIDHSTFRHLGRCDRDLSCAHSIYVGAYGRLTVTRSRFEAGDGGHYVKSRAPVADIRNNSFDDSAGHLTNYMVDLSNGASGVISGNEMVQGRDKDNYSAFITVAPEGREVDSSGLTVTGNAASFVPGVSRQSTFVANWTDDAVKVGQNRLGSGIRPTDRR